MNHLKPALSVVIPVYNASAYITGCFETLSSQDRADFEVIFVDDGSTDNSLELCNQYAKKHPDVRVIHKENGGAGSARNMGLTEVKGEYVYFLDADDTLCPTLFSDALAAAHENNADIVIFGLTKYILDSLGNTTAVVKSIPYISGGMSYEGFKERFKDLFSMCPYSVCNKLYRTAYLLENSARFPEEPIGEDARFNLTLYTNTKTRFAFLNKSYYNYFQRIGGSMKKYYPERCGYELAVAELLSNVINGFGLPWAERYTDIADTAFVRVLEQELENVSIASAPLSNAERVCRMRKLAKHQKIHNALRSVPLKDYRGGVKIKMLLMKLGMFSAVIALKKR